MKKQRRQQVIIIPLLIKQQQAIVSGIKHEIAKQISYRNQSNSTIYQYLQKEKIFNLDFYIKQLILYLSWLFNKFNRFLLNTSEFYLSKGDICMYFYHIR